MKKIAVVILNYCNYRETEICVESVMNQKGVVVEIIDAEFVLFLNSDIVLKGEDCITNLISEYEPGIGVIGARIIERNGKEKGAYFECIESPEIWWMFFFF